MGVWVVRVWRNALGGRDQGILASFSLLFIALRCFWELFVEELLSCSYLLGQLFEVEELIDYSWESTDNIITTFLYKVFTVLQVSYI